MVIPPPITVEEYTRLAIRDDVRQELHLGRIVVLPWPRKGHITVRHQLFTLLTAHSHDKGFVAPSLAFRAIPEYDVRTAHVAFVTQERWDRTPDDDYLHGSPELVIEILSASSIDRELQVKA